nr:PAC2 family protein [Bifidobacterium bohemicum]
MDQSSKRVMICAFEGWNDACHAATNVIHHLISHYDATEVRNIRSDAYYDYKSVRPVICHMDGTARIIWPETSFYDITINPSTHIFAQIAPEPNYKWVEYVRRSLRIADELEIDEIITLGSMFADCPHTRPLPMDELGFDPIHKVMDYDSSMRDYGPSGGCACDGPVGITTVYDAIGKEEGFDTTSLWISIPQYLSGDDCAQATLQMLRRLSDRIKVPLEEYDLPEKAAHWSAQASVLLSCNDELREYVNLLEKQYDMGSQLQILNEESRGDRLAKEVEEYLEQLDK